MKAKKDFYPLNSDILNNLSLDELEERLELEIACWWINGASCDITCSTAALTCAGYWIN
jgi:hypothetical protein